MTEPYCLALQSIIKDIYDYATHKPQIKYNFHVSNKRLMQCMNKYDTANMQKRIANTIERFQNHHTERYAEHYEYEYDLCMIIRELANITFVFEEDAVRIASVLAGYNTVEYTNANNYFEDCQEFGHDGIYLFNDAYDSLHGYRNVSMKNTIYTYIQMDKCILQNQIIKLLEQFKKRIVKLFKIIMHDIFADDKQTRMEAGYALLHYTDFIRHMCHTCHDNTLFLFVKKLHACANGALNH